MISKNIKYYRLMKFMSKKELADAVNVTPMAISNYESGKRIPEMDILKRIANVLGVRISDFLVIRNKDIKFRHNEFRKCSSLTKEKQELIYEIIEEYFNRFMDWRCNKPEITITEYYGHPELDEYISIDFDNKEPLEVEIKKAIKNTKKFISVYLDWYISKITAWCR